MKKEGAMRLRSAFFLLASLVPASLAAKPLRLAASSPWNLDYADNSCRLMRTFGEDRQKVLLLIEGWAPGRMDILAVGNALESPRPYVSARFVPTSTETFDGEASRAAATNIPGVLWRNPRMVPDEVYDRLEKQAEEQKRNRQKRPDPFDPSENANLRLARQDFADRATALEIQTNKARPLILETGSMGEPIRLFEKCTRDSLKDWGVDPEMEDKIVRPVWAPNPQGWFSSNDYPSRMFAAGEQADISIRVLVDATGKVTKCTSISHFKEKDFDEITCARFRSRATFEPAELADGTKVPSFYTTRVIFRIAL